MAASQGAGQDDVAARRGVKFVVLDADVLTVKIQIVLTNRKKIMWFELKSKVITHLKVTITKGKMYTVYIYSFLTQVHNIRGRH